MTIHSKSAGWLLAVALLAAGVGPAAGQNTQPVWWPPLSLYGRPVAQPYFDFPVWARYCNCRPAPLTWGYDPFPNYGPDECGDSCWDYPSVNCPGDFVAHRPESWYASVDAAPLRRVYQNAVLAREFVPFSPGFQPPPPDADFTDPGDVPPTPPFFTDPVLESTDLAQDYDLGAKVTVGRRFGCYRIEGTYLGYYFWQDAATVSRSPNSTLATMFSGFDIPADGMTFFGATQVSIFSETRLWSAEANLRYWMDMPPGPFDVSILFGGRYMRIDDAFRLVVTDGTTADVQAETENTLIGAQIGIAGDWMIHPRFWINTDLKVGVFDNQTTLAYDDGETVTPGEGNSTAIVGDISVAGHWQMTPWLVFNIGYQVLIVDNIATGLNNVINPPFAGGIGGNTTQFDERGQLTFHGPTIGLMAVW